MQGIHNLVLDRMCIRHREIDHEADQFVSSICANITSLDLGGNLFESWNEILLVCRLFPRLSSLTLDGNRFRNIEGPNSSSDLPNIRYLSLTDTLSSPDEVSLVIKTFPSLQTLILANNELGAWNTSSSTSGLPETIHSVDLSGNQITTLASLESLLTLPNPRQSREGKKAGDIGIPCSCSAWFLLSCYLRTPWPIHQLCLSIL